MHLPDGAAGGRLAAGDLPQRDLLALARALADLQRDGGVGQLVLVGPAAASSVQVTVVNAGPGRSAAGPLR